MSFGQRRNENGFAIRMPCFYNEASAVCKPYDGAGGAHGAKILTRMLGVQRVIWRRASVPSARKRQGRAGLTTL